MSKIKIERKNEYNNRFRNYKIYIDNELQGTIANGETKEFEIDSTGSQHTVRAVIDWCSSPDLIITINNQETKILKTGSISSKYLRYILLSLLLFTVLNYIYTKEINLMLTAIFIAPVFLFQLYILSFGRKKYLSLSEVKSQNRS